VLFACETKALMIFAILTMKQLLDNCQEPEEFEAWFGMNDEIKEHGIGAKIWE